MLPLCLQLNELTLLLAIFFAFAALPACSRQAKPEIKIEQLTPEQQARAKAIARRLLSTSCGLRMSGLRGSRRPKRLAAPRAQRARAHARVLARIISRTRSLSSSAFSARWSSFFCSGSASSSSSASE